MKKLNQTYYKLILCLFFLLLLANPEVFSQNNNKLSSFEGRNFYVAFMQNEITYTTRDQEPNALELFITSGDTANVTLRFRSDTRNITIYPNKIEKVIYGREVIQNKSEEVANLSIHVTSDIPITIYGINSIPASSDMFSAIPTVNWGKEYVVMSYPNDNYKDTNESEPNVPRKSQFCVIASVDNTNVTITPAANTALGKPANIPFTVKLNKGQTYLVQSSNVINGGDLTGSYVSSDKPVGVMSGHVRTAILQDLSVRFDTKDHLVEMMTPVSAWGKNFITTPFQFADNKEDGNLFRVVSRVPGAVLTIRRANGAENTYVFKSSNPFIEIQDLHVPAIWSCTEPIQIMQYMKHTGINDNSNYDPSMCLVPPTEQFVEQILVQIPNNSSVLQVSNQYEVHKAMLVIEKSAVPTLKLDGVEVRNMSNLNLTDIPGTDYCWTRFQLGTGIHLFSSTTGRFSGVLYGYGKNDSYSVIMGSSLLPLKMLDTTPPVIKVNAICDEITGYAFESRDTLLNSGIDYLYVNKNYTNNYTYTFGEFTDSSTTISIHAKVIDDSKPATIELYARDRSGNTSVFKHTFQPFVPLYSNKDIIGDVVDWHDSKCYDTLWVVNNSTIPYTLNSITSDNPKVRISHTETLPRILQPGEKFKYTACVYPNGDFNDINSNIKLKFNCDKEYSYKLNLRVSACELISDKQLDFAEEFVGQEKCKEIKLSNSGKFDIKITGLKNISTNTGVFEYKTKNAFPIILKPDETKQLKICFKPTDKVTYQEKYELEYNCEKKIEISLTGKGIGSELNNLSHDFGKVPLTRTALHSFTLTNNGNAPAPIKFSGIESDNNNYNIDEFAQINRTLQPGESHRFTVTYFPKTLGKHSLKAKYTLKLDKEIDYIMELNGEGVNPGIAYKDHDMGTIHIFTTKDTVLKVAQSTGTEQLTIKSITAESGAISSFEFDPVPLTVVKPGDSLMLKVRFKPEYIDLHKIRLQITHNAESIDSYSQSYFVISGISVPHDTINRNIELSLIDSDNPCNEVVINAKVVNRGNITTVLKQVEVIADEKIKGQLSHKFQLPITLKPGELAEASYKFINLSTAEGIIKFIFKFDNDETREAEYNYKPSFTVKNLILVKNDKVRFKPGDTVSLQFEGKFPHKTAIPVNASVRITTNPQVLSLLKGTYSLEIQNNLEKIQKDLVLFQKNDYFDIPLFDTLLLNGENVHWKIKLKFATSFKSERYNHLYLSFISNDCFNAAEDSIATEMIEVCLHENRDIQVVSVPKLKTFYNHQKQSLFVEFENNIHNQKINIEIYDINGKLIRKFVDIIPKMGGNQMSFNLSELPDGAYFYRINGLFINENNKFIK